MIRMTYSESSAYTSFVQIGVESTDLSSDLGRGEDHDSDHLENVVHLARNE